MPLNREKIEKTITNPVTVRVFSSVGSTNDEAKRNAETDEGAVLYAADSQTAGRGRRGHSFYSPPTGLYMTLSLPVAGGITDVQRLTCAAAVAVCEAMRDTAGEEPAVKWVNDIFLGGKKVAGILAELVTDAHNRPRRVIIGIGVNLTTTDFPADFAARAAGIGDVDPSLLCAAITDRLIGSYSRLSDPALMERYKALNLVLGHAVNYTDREGRHTAVAADISPDGGLVVVENGTQRILSSGEISIGSPADEVR